MSDDFMWEDEATLKALVSDVTKAVETHLPYVEVSPDRLEGYLRELFEDLGVGFLDLEGEDE